MILVLLEKGLVLEGFFPSKIEVIWVLGIYIYILYLNSYIRIIISNGWLEIGS